MKEEIYEILTELQRLLAVVKVSGDGGTDEFYGKIQGLVSRVGPLVKEIDNLQELERIREAANKCASLASEIFLDQDLKYRELRRQYREESRKLKASLDELRKQGVRPRFFTSLEKLENFLDVLDADIEEKKWSEPS